MSSKPTTFIRDLAEYVTRGMLLSFEAIISIDACGSATLLSRKQAGGEALLCLLWSGCFPIANSYRIVSNWETFTLYLSLTESAAHRFQVRR